MGGKPRSQADLTLRALVDDLARQLKRHDLAEIEVGRGTLHARVVAASGHHHSHALASAAPTLESSSAPSAAESKGVSSTDADAEARHTITSPFVGTFYRSPSPGAKPYATVGDKVSEGTVLCIVEAMKLMNEIESDHTGTVVEILVEDQDHVDFGQPLFVLE